MNSDPKINLSKAGCPPPPPPPPRSTGILPPPPPPPDFAGPSARDTSNRDHVRIAIALLGAIVVLGGLGWGVWALTVDTSTENDPVAQMISATDNARLGAPTSQRLSAPSVAAAVTLPTGSMTCPALYGPVGEYRSSATGTTITSCPFAEEVRIAYAASGGVGVSRRVSAFSPITNRFYDMDCATGQFVTCRGGNDAVVYVY